MPTGRSGSAGRPIALADAVTAAYARADWPGLRALYHDEALLSTLAAQQVIVPPDELIRILTQVTAETIYEVDEMTSRAIDDDAVIVTGRIRYPLAAGGFAEGNRAWLLTFKDDLLFRTCAYTTAAKARAAYAAHGIDLGIQADLLPLVPDDPAPVPVET